MNVTSVLRAVHVAGHDHPHRPAVLVVEPDGTMQFTAADLAADMDAWARGLSPMRPDGAAPGSAVAVVVAPRGFTGYTSVLGAMRAGMAGCFLPGPTAKQDPASYWESHRAVLARISPAVVVAPGALAAMLGSVLPAGTPIVDASAPPPPGPDPLPALESVDGDTLPAILQHSSGTTGLKKGVVLTYGQVRDQIAAYSAALGMTRDDVVASWLPLYHDMGLVTALLMPLSIGAMVVTMDPFDWLARPGSILEAISRYRASFCWLPNFAFAHLANVAADDGPFDLSSVRAFIDCSEPCRAGTIDAFVSAFAPHGLRAGAVATCYAMAETVFAVTQSRPGEPPARLSIDQEAMAARSIAVPVPHGAPGSVSVLSCGQPITGTTIRIAPRHGPAMAPDGSAIGEIVVASGSAFAGYHRDAAASAAVLDGRWYRTGDLGFIHAGELYVSGRLKDLIIVNGRNIHPHDIEAAACRVPEVKPGRAVAFGVDRDAAGSEGAVVVVESIATLGPAATAVALNVRDAVAEALGLILHDVVVCRPGVLIKTTSGKACRTENRRRYAGGAMA